MNHNFLKRSTFPIASIVLLFSLPGCWGPSEEKEPTAETAEQSMKTAMVTQEQEALTGEVVVTMGGKPIVTSDSLQVEKDKLIESNPQFKAMLAFMDPKQFDRNLSEGLTNQAIVDKYVTDNGIDKKAQYQKELMDGYKAVERMISTKYFSESFTASVSEREAREFYEKNKGVMPQLLLAQGGVETVGVEFDTKEKADEFLAKVQKNGNLQEAAAMEGMTDKVKDFKMVTQQSVDVNQKIKDRVLGFKSCPQAEVVELDATTYVVVQGVRKKEPEYRPFEQVKEDIKSYLEKEKQAEEFDKEIEKLKVKYNVKVNEDYFGGEENQEVAMYDVDEDINDVEDQALA